MQLGRAAKSAARWKGRKAGVRALRYISKNISAWRLTIWPLLSAGSLNFTFK
jgi:hypothetical protein